MGVDPLSLGLGGLGMITQKNANNSEENQAQQQFALQKALMQMQVGDHDRMLGIAQGLDSQGYFDPQKQLDAQAPLLEHSTDLAHERALGDTQAMGYRPGDSAPLDNINRIQGDSGLQLKDLMFKAYQQAMGNKLAAYGAVNPGSLNTAIGTLGDNARFNIGREQGLGGLIQSIMPYLKSMQGGNGMQPPGSDSYHYTAQAPDTGYTPSAPSIMPPTSTMGSHMMPPVSPFAAPSTPSAPVGRGIMGAGRKTGTYVPIVGTTRTGL